MNPVVRSQSLPQGLGIGLTKASVAGAASGQLQNVPEEDKEDKIIPEDKVSNSETIEESGGSDAPKEDDKKEAGVITKSSQLVDTINQFKSNSDTLASRLESVNRLLAKFSEKQKEARSASSPALLAKKKEVKKEGCPILDILSVDLLRKIFSLLEGKHILMICSTGRAMKEAQDDRELWEQKLREEICCDGNVLEKDAQKLKKTYRVHAVGWTQVITTLRWLARLGYPCEVSGTKNGIPLRHRISEALDNATTLTCGSLLLPERLTELREAALKPLTSLIQSPNDTMKEKAACVMANLISKETGGGDFLKKYMALRPAKAMMMSNCIGLRKQAARLLVNAWLDSPQRVTMGCPPSQMLKPYRGEVLEGGVEWLMVEFTPGGQPSGLMPLTMWCDEHGKLQGRGRDSMGSYSFHQATLNRALQWAHGPSLENQPAQPAPARLRRMHSMPGRLAVPDSSANKDVDVETRSPAASSESDLASPKKAPESPDQPRAMFQNASNQAILQGLGVRDEVAERMRGFQNRYTNDVAGAESTTRVSSSGKTQAEKLMSVMDGVEHVELLKSHSTAHGIDHVKFVAFPDKEGYWGYWERGRFYYQDKIDGGSRGVFRMWQADVELEDESLWLWHDTD